MKKKTKTKKNKIEYPEGVQAKHLQVTIEEVGGDKSKMVKKFLKKVRKSEILKPFFGKLMYYIPKSETKHRKMYEFKYNLKKKKKKSHND